VTDVERFASVAGRVLLSLIFLVSGVGKVFDWPGTASYMEAHGMRAVPLFLFAAIVLEIGGGISLLLGCRARWGALALAVFLVPATIIFHNFLLVEGAERQAQMIQVLKNLALLGGLLFVYGRGAGPYSVDGERR
jgi:putative oxidoreductase